MFGLLGITLKIKMKLGIITPIGPGHVESYQKCLESINFAWDKSKGNFSSLEIIMQPDLEGHYGRSNRRNCGIEEAIQKKCDWLFFLDADDLMSPDAFEKAAPFLDDYDAIFGAICEMPFGQPNQLRLRNPQLEETTNYLDLLLYDPFLTLQMGHFVRSDIANRIKFDEQLDVGEDFKYYLTLCEDNRFIKIKDILFINQRGNNSVGPRSGNGAQWREAVQSLIIQKIQEKHIVATINLNNIEASFVIKNPFDIIQATMLYNQFFEQNELLELIPHIGLGKKIVEIGANIGNHTVFYGKHLNPSKIFPFEPNIDSIDMLMENISLNKLEKLIDSRGIGIGLGRVRGKFETRVNDKNNLGAACLIEGGDIDVFPLDEVIGDEAVDFIKIDVEGMEMLVLEGAKNTINKNRPKIYIEIFNHHIEDFIQWVEINQYQFVLTHRLINAVNFLVEPMPLTET